MAKLPNRRSGCHRQISLNIITLLLLFYVMNKTITIIFRQRGHINKLRPVGIQTPHAAGSIETKIYCYKFSYSAFTIFYIIVAIL